MPTFLNSNSTWRRDLFIYLFIYLLFIMQGLFSLGNERIYELVTKGLARGEYNKYIKVEYCGKTIENFMLFRL